jgi:hypothetical protein
MLSKLSQCEVLSKVLGAHISEGKSTNKNRFNDDSTNYKKYTIINSWCKYKAGFENPLNSIDKLVGSKLFV